MSVGEWIWKLWRSTGVGLAPTRFPERRPDPAARQTPGVPLHVRSKVLRPDPRVEDLLVRRVDRRDPPAAISTATDWRASPSADAASSRRGEGASLRLCPYVNPWMTVREDEIRRPDESVGIYGVVDKPDFALSYPGTATVSGSWSSNAIPSSGAPGSSRRAAGAAERPAVKRAWPAWSWPKRQD